MTSRLENHNNAVQWACGALARAETEGHKRWMIKQLLYFTDRSPLAGVRETAHEAIWRAGGDQQH